MHTKKVNLIDIPAREIYPVEISFDSKIQKISRIDEQQEHYILPGFIDAHVHIESSMLTPSEFARLAVVHGTVCTVSDPHEIANVLGLEGVEFMIRDGKRVNFKFNFGAPSCVPATPFETAGSSLDAAAVTFLLARKEIKYLAEMMNWPGVLNGDPEVLEKIRISKAFGKPVDGHAPGLKGSDAQNYVAAGISTDHECFTGEEALDKLKHGMKIIIREGSAAKNFEALVSLINDYQGQIMFCSDDKHPDYLVESHIDELVRRSLTRNQDLYKVLTAACLTPVSHYDLEVGLLKEGDPSDFIQIDNPQDFNVQETWINGDKVAENGISYIQHQSSTTPNRFATSKKSADSFHIPIAGPEINVIEAQDGQLVTNKLVCKASLIENENQVSLAEDILKITVVNRYKDAEPAVAFIHNFGMKRGAIASSVAHDSHNIVCVGTSDDSIANAVNLVIESKGGLSAVTEDQKRHLALPIAGLMSNIDGYEVAKLYSEIDRFAKDELGCTLTSPFMTLSFMALLVIPSLKLSDKGLFNGDNFAFCPVS